MHALLFVTDFKFTRENNYSVFFFFFRDQKLSFYKEHIEYFTLEYFECFVHEIYVYDMNFKRRDFEVTIFDRIK